MNHILLINLGMGNTKDYGPLGYAGTEYRFDDGFSCRTHLAGLALWRWLEDHEMQPLSVCFAATPEVWEEKAKPVEQEVDAGGLDWSKVAEPIIFPLPRSLDQIWQGLPSLEKWINHYSIAREEVPTLHIDLTHAYRAIPIVHTWMTLYFKRLGNVEIGFMGYGAFVPGAEGPTPMIDLSPMMQLAEWAAAARDFEKRGDAGALSELMADDGKKIRSRVYSGAPTEEEMQALKILGSATKAAEAIGRYLPAGLPIELGIKTRRALGETRREDVEAAVRTILPPAAPVAGKIFDTAFKIAWQGEMPPAKNAKKNLALSREEIDRQLVLVRLWAERGATGAALRALRELMVTRVTLAQGIHDHWLHEEIRKAAGEALNSLRPSHNVAFRSLPEGERSLGGLWHEICEARNLFAHAGMKGDEVHVDTKANQLAGFIDRFVELDTLGDEFWRLDGRRVEKDADPSPQ